MTHKVRILPSPRPARLFRSRGLCASDGIIWD
jgi:hypothetical protein